MRFVLFFVLLESVFLVPSGSEAAEMTSENQATTSVGGGSFDLGSFLGADAYYNNPRTPIVGQNTVAYNLEAGHIWSGHESLSHVSVFLNDSTTWGNGSVEALYDRHATWAGMLIGGRGSGLLRQTGLAPGVDLRSAAIATSWGGNAYGLSFSNSAATYVTAFANSFPVADVVNSSFGYADAGGSDVYTIFTDAMVFLNPTTTYVTSAGNSGSAANSVGAPGAGYNTITVGALGGANSYSAAASFSSRGPQDFSYAVGNAVVSVAGVRAPVDISAPGTSITSAYYGGQTGGNNPSLPGSVDLGTDPAAYSTVAGTSFSAPIVAGGAALVASASKTLPELSGNIEARSNLVVKSLLLNGADKITGWNNGQFLQNGVITTNQSLDHATGTGRMNLANTFETQLRGQTGVAGTSIGVQGEVQELGWDFGRALIGAANDYIISNPLVGSSNFTTTLTWQRIRDWDADSGQLYEDAQADLNLSLWRLGENNAFETLVAQSTSLYNTVEHLSLTIPESGHYGLRVSYPSNTFANFANWGTLAFPQTYGLAWSGTALTTLYWGGGGLWNGTDTPWNTTNASGGTARSATTPYSTLVVDSPGNHTLLVEDSQQAAGLILNNGTATFTGNASASLAIGSGGIQLGSGGPASATFGASLPLVATTHQIWSNSSSNPLVFDSEVSGSADVTVDADSTGAVVWNGTHSRTGNTTVADGLLIVNGNSSSSLLTTIGAGATLGGSGRVGNLRLENGGSLAPGNSPGSLLIDGHATWLGGGQYNWQVAAANPDAADQNGAGTGWDLLEISQSLTLSGFDTGSNRFHLNLWSLSGGTPDQNGAVSGYDPAVGSTWLIARTGRGITLNGALLAANTDYSAYFNIHTAAANGAGGWVGSVPQTGFRVVTLHDALSIYLLARAATSVPEPGSIAASLLLLAGLCAQALIKGRGR